MPPHRDGNITNSFQRKSEGQGKTKTEEPTANSPRDAPTASSSREEDKNNGKRRISDSPPTDERCNVKALKADAPTHLSSKDLAPNWLTATGNVTSTTLSLSTHQGDLFDQAPPNCLLVHACNTQGSWGAGIARTFRERYPKAYTIYRDFCTKEHNPRYSPVLPGTALIIPPVDSGKSQWIGCLFTSAKYGKAKAKPEAILRNTTPAMQMLLELIRQADEITELRMCKINSGLFGVPWEETQEALESIKVREGWRANVEIWEP
ncbi:uncharacterized protein K460DRAFT_283804 [Cucurbitaria berberidis CBS 394.84]|uniref:ADP-ribose 1''-phosphate phosphatase n=1 Tax=Cucurbitaria berberidis CBS 394.84 TaxID=1168544 RepID=A0A9P4GHU5_9PLEO|nr:uncharacterized protein K460DRAFT_283804 [Cucurbitaria berberidis CBS 394.84]KAF1846438.1 hypothetical protein K460DRAFT_283804 [Cucurbitaria berberidis CBS 394.84]